MFTPVHVIDHVISNNGAIISNDILKVLPIKDVYSKTKYVENVTIYGRFRRSRVQNLKDWQ